MAKRKIIFRVLQASLALLLIGGAVAGWRAYRVYQTAYGGFQHWRHLLESGETIDGMPADDVFSDSYLLSIFGGNPELVDRLKSIIDLGMAADDSLKTGNVSAMMVTYKKTPEGAIEDTAIYAVGGFPDPQSRRLGFHSTGYFHHQIDPSLWLTGNSIMNLLGRDVIIFCEQEKVEQHMSLMFDLLQGDILSLAERVASSTLHYALVFPEPKPIAPPNLKNYLQTIIVRGEMGADHGHSEITFISPTIRGAYQTFVIFNDMARLSRITFHDHFGGYIKEMPWGPMNDTWWAVEYVELIDSLKVVHDQILVTARVQYRRVQNNAILKTIERAGRDLAMQKAFVLSGDLPWEFAFKDQKNPSGGYWSPKHRWGPEWPLGEEGIPTPESIAAVAERERLQAEKEEQKRLEKEEKERQKQPSADAPQSTLI